MTIDENAHRQEGKSERPRVLLVDDDVHLRTALRRFLEDSGIEIVGEAGDAPAGIEQARAANPDVIVVDLRLPGGGGIEATKVLKDAVPHAKVFVLSAYDDRELMSQARAAGADDFHVKGSPPRALRDAILSALNPPLPDYR